LTDEEDQIDEDDHDLRRSKRAEAQQRAGDFGYFSDRDHDVQTVRLTSL